MLSRVKVNASSYVTMVAKIFTSFQHEFLWFVVFFCRVYLI
jgi:hypothetical protein